MASVPPSYAQCVAQVKADYPVPPGNINAQNQMIQDQCGSLILNEGEGIEISFEISEPIEIQHLADQSQGVLIATKSTVYYGPSALNADIMLPCISFFGAGTNQVGMRNNCSECKKAVVMWSGVGVYKYQVNGYSQIIVPMVSSNGQLIGEEPC